MTPGIVFINQATGYLAIDIINNFVNDFEDVVLITGSVRVQDTILNPKIKTEHIARYDRGNNLKKAISWIRGSFEIFLLLKFRYNRYDKFYFTVPPTAYLMAPWFRGKFSILVFDLYPDALNAKGLSKHGILYRLWASRNRAVFNKSHKIYTLSNSMKSGIERYSSGIEVAVIPNWSGFSHLQPVKKGDNKILEREGLIGKFVVQYSGNIGVTHNVETLVDLAESLSMESDIVFQIIGRGERSNEIARRIKEKQLSNCFLLGFRDDGELYESLCAADLAVIMLDDRTPDISIPSKIYNIMSAGLPVMAIAAPGSGVADLVVNHNIGKVFEKNDIQEMGLYVLELKNNPEIKSIYSSNSLKTSALFTSSNAGLYLQRYFE
jgi:glycosyltransferase involved in cell wall biosynthesis